LQQPSLWVAGIVVAHRGRVDPVRSEGLELEEHVGFQHRDWLAQRIAWVLMVLFVGAAAVGLFGSGPLSRARADVPGLMTLEYDRFGRLETTEALKVRLEPAATRGGTVRLWVTREFLESARVESVVPPPTRVELADGRLVYVFDVDEPGVPMNVTFNVQPEEIGRSEARLGLDSAAGRRDVAFRRFVYP